MTLEDSSNGNVISLADYLDEREARRAGGWGVFEAACPRCDHVWIAVAPLSAATHLFECPRCRGVPQLSDGLTPASTLANLGPLCPAPSSSLSCSSVAPRSRSPMPTPIQSTSGCAAMAARCPTVVTRALNHAFPGAPKGGGPAPAAPFAGAASTPPQTALGAATPATSPESSAEVTCARGRSSGAASSGADDPPGAA